MSLCALLTTCNYNCLAHYTILSSLLYLPAALISWVYLGYTYNVLMPTSVHLFCYNRQWKNNYYTIWVLAWTIYGQMKFYDIFHLQFATRYLPPGNWHSTHLQYAPFAVLWHWFVHIYFVSMKADAQLLIDTSLIFKECYFLN